MFNAFRNLNTLPADMSVPDYPVPSLQTAMEMDTCADPIASISINEKAKMPLFPGPRAGIHTLVKVMYTSPNPIDYKLLAMYWMIPWYIVGHPPIIPGASFVGTVWRTTHPNLRAGDLVWGKHDEPSRFGSGGEYTLVAGDQGIHKIPENWSASQGVEELAGAALVALTALQSLKAVNIPYNTTDGAHQGGSIFINGGSGGVGIFTIQLAKHIFGCENILVSCSGSNVDFVRSLGATETVDYRSCPSGVSGWLKDWSKRNGLLDGIIDNVGSDSTIYWHCHEYLKEGSGQYIQVGGGLHLSAIVETAKKMLWPRLLGGGQRQFQFQSTKNKSNDFVSLGKWMAEGKIKCVIEDENRFELADSKKAYQKLDTGRTRGKIVIKIS